MTWAEVVGLTKFADGNSLGDHADISPRHWLECLLPGISCSLVQRMVSDTVGVFILFKSF